MVLYVCRGWFVNQSLRQRILRPRKLVRLIASVWFRLSSKKLLKALYWLLHLEILSEFHEKKGLERTLEKHLFTSNISLLKKS